MHAHTTLEPRATGHGALRSAGRTLGTVRTCHIAEPCSSRVTFHAPKLAVPYSSRVTAHTRHIVLVSRHGPRAVARARMHRAVITHVATPCLETQQTHPARHSGFQYYSQRRFSHTQPPDGHAKVPARTDPRHPDTQTETAVAGHVSLTWSVRRIWLLSKADPSCFSPECLWSRGFALGGVTYRNEIESGRSSCFMLAAAGRCGFAECRGSCSSADANGATGAQAREEAAARVLVAPRGAVGVRRGRGTLRTTAAQAREEAAARVWIAP
eukprot:6435509-Prymnesium_polylepis.1